MSVVEGRADVQATWPGSPLLATSGSDTRFQIRRQTFSSLLPPNRELFKSRFAKARKMNDIDSQAWLADVLVRTAEYPAQRLDELLPWN